MQIWDHYLNSLEIIRCFGIVEISAISDNSFITTFDWKRSFKFWWFHRKDLVQIYHDQSYFNLKIYFHPYKSIFKWRKMIYFIILEKSKYLSEIVLTYIKRLIFEPVKINFIWENIRFKLIFSRSFLNF